MENYRHKNPFGHVVFDHDYVIEDGGLIEDSAVFTAHLSNLPEFEIWLEFNLNTPRKEVRKKLVDKLKSKIVLFKDFICSECDIEAPLSAEIKYDYIITDYGEVSKDPLPSKTGKGTDHVLFKPYFAFKETNKDIIRPLFKKWFKENRNN